MTAMSPLHDRGLGSTSHKNNNFTPHQILVTQIVAISCASLSLMFTFVASYWFIRMRKSFRHKLIMLLIQSDLFKAIWYFTFPLVAFVRGPIPTSSPFCQVAGFCISFGTEASDFAILMIAIHASLYVFRSKTSGTEAGLYTYRYYVYAFWIIWATLMAGLAFVNPVDAYLSGGTICSLPVRPFWYRLALSWIPRYLILLTVIGLYILIYVYVHYKFKGIDTETSGAKHSSNEFSRHSSQPGKPTTLPTGTIPKIVMRRPTSLARHGLIPSDDTGLSNQTNRLSAGEKPVWEKYDFGGSQPVSPLTESQNTLLLPPEGRPGSSRTISDDVFREPSTNSEEPRGNYFLLHALRDSRIKSFAPTSESESTTAVATVDGADTAPGKSTANGNSKTPNESGNVASASLRRRHRAIKQKLRLLFIYPLVYLLMYMIPFSQHCLQYSDYYSQNPPFPLSVCSVACLALQGTIDSIVFTIREKPWRYVGKGRFFPWSKPRNEFIRRRRYSGSGIEGSLVEGPDGNVQRVPRPSVKNSRESVISTRKGFGGSASLRNSNESVMSAKKGLIKEKNWWEMEGRIRMDSVLLGTDHDHAEQAWPGRRGSAQLGGPVIKEEEESIQPSNPGDTGGQSEGFGSGRRGYGGLHGGRRDSTGTGRTLPAVVGRSSVGNEGRRHSYGFTESRRPSATETPDRRSSVTSGLEEIELTDVKKD